MVSHTDLCKIGGRWLKKHQQNIKIPNCPTVAVDMVTIESEIPDIIGWNSACSVMIEVKVGRSDFLKDKKKPFRINPTMGVGEFRYYLCPNGLIDIIDLPNNWGLLYFDNNKISIIKIAGYQDSNICAERNMLLSLIRRKL